MPHRGFCRAHRILHLGSADAQTHTRFPYPHTHTHLIPHKHAFPSSRCLPISSLAARAQQLRVGGVTLPRISQPSSRSARSTTIKILLPLEGGQESKFTAVHSCLLLQPHPYAFSVCAPLPLSLPHTDSHKESKLTGLRLTYRKPFVSSYPPHPPTQQLLLLNPPRLYI